MIEFLQQEMSLVVGAVVLLLVFGVRLLTGDKDLRADLKGAFFLMVGFLGLRSLAWILDGHLQGTPANVLRLAWMLAFAFGIIRASVSILLWLVRFRKRTPTPKILRDVINFTLYAIAFLPIFKWTLKVDLAGLIATSAILSVVLGFALQDTLGNLFAGLSLQLERPFEVGDVITVGKYTGRIAQVGWRATRIETFRGEHVTLPNNIIAKEAVMNYSRGTQPIGLDLYLGISYRVPPNQVKGAILDTMRALPDVLSTPPCHVRTWEYAEHSMKYQIRYFVRDYELGINVMEQLYTRLWYRFERDGIELSLPQRVVQMRQELPRIQTQAPDEVFELLSSVDLLSMLKPDDLRVLASEVLPRRFAARERVITEGQPGNTFYVVADGSVSVRAGRSETEVAQLSRGQYFGEMSLLTGEPRVASVIALQDTLLYEVTRPTFARILAANQGLAGALAALLAQRRTELQARASSGVATVVDTAPEARRIFGRLRELFGLHEP